MDIAGVYKVGKAPFFVFFDDLKSKQIFLSDYTPEKGFGIYFQGERNYRVYTNTHCFRAMPFVPQMKGVIGIGLKYGAPMNQSQTLEAAVKRVQVLGLAKIFFCVKGQQTPNILMNGAADLFEYVNRECSVRRTAADIPDTEDQIAFVEEQAELITNKKTFDENNLFSVEYSSFEDTLQNLQDGTVYKFHINGVKRDELEEKFKENTGVDISCNDQGRPLIGTVIDYKKGALYIKFHIGDAYSRIAASGTIRERINPEYNYKLDALRLLRNDLSPNKYLLPILADRKVRPISIKTKYDPNAGGKKKNVNPSQIDAIEKALNVEDFLLVQGPPGTGKTTIITEMIEHFVKNGQRVLICSKNNLAVDNVLEKCQKLYYDEAKQRKMQCLRLGNEEKVIPSVRGALPRRLTLQIQNDIKEKSDEARTGYIEKDTRLLAAFEHTVEDSSGLLGLTDFFLKRKDLYKDILATYHRSFWAMFLGGKRRNNYEKIVSYLIEQTDILAKQILAPLQMEQVAIRQEAVQRYLEMAHTVFDSMIMLEECLNSASIRFGLVLNSKKGSTLQDINASKRRKDDILKGLCAIPEYKGNPVANEMYVLNFREELSGDFVDRFGKEVDDQIRRLKSRELLLKQVLDEWHEELKSDQSSLEEPLLRTVNIIGATCIGVNTKSDFRNVEYDVAIVDEAGQITLHDLLVPLVKAKKIILIGDHLQLPPSDEDEFCNYIRENNLMGFDNMESREEEEAYLTELKKTFSVSLFEKLFRDSAFNKNKVMLDTQFRMHPDIAEFISRYFYENKYKSGVTAAQRTLKISGFDRSLYFFDTCNMPGKTETQAGDKEHPTYVNHLEAQILARHVSNVIVDIDNDRFEGSMQSLMTETGEYDIGIITGYKKQVEVVQAELRKCLEEHYEPARVENILSRVAINTVDSFQGRDNQIIFYSFVRSNPEHGVGFLKDVRRLNVMMTRAKSLLVMVGDSETLSLSNNRTVHDGRKASDYFKALIAYAKEKRGYIDYAKEV